MASGGLSAKPSPMPRTTKPPPVGPKPQPGGGHSHSQLGGRSMATSVADAAARWLNSSAKHTHGHGRGSTLTAALCVDYSLYDRHQWARPSSANGHHAHGTRTEARGEERNMRHR